MPALDGLRVLDMTQYEAGTSCTQWLAWMGADVVKVEGPTGDPGRYTGKDRGDESPGDPQYFMNYNGNKRSIVLDLKSADGRQLLLDLVPHFHVFVENYGPGVVESLQIGPEVLRREHPSLIYTRIKGFGLSGPYSTFKVYDWVAQAAAGTFSVTGDSDGPPAIVGPTIGDSGTGIQAAFAIVSAYVQQQRTGEGQVIELSMQEAVTMFMRTLDLKRWGKEPVPREGLRRGRAGGGLYPCRGNGANDWVFLYPATTRMLDALWMAIGRPELAGDPRFETEDSRSEHEDDLRALVTEWTRCHEKREVMQVLGSAGVPCSYVFDTIDLFTDPHLQERGFIREIDHPVNGPMQLMGNPLRMPGVVEQQRAPFLGEHTDEVLETLLNLDADELHRLRAQGVTQPRPL